MEVLDTPRPASGDRWNLESARKYCRRLAEQHYENFPVGSRWVKAELRPHMHAIYAFARTADDFADEAEHGGLRLERLQVWRTMLHDAVAGNATHPVFIALADTISEKQIPIQWLNDLITAFEWDVEKNRHPTFESIVEYAKFSANPVGRLVLWLHDYRKDELFELSDAICSALQFANFWQDVAVDLKKNRIYIPQHDMAEVGYTEVDLHAGIADRRFQRLLGREIDRTRELFTQGRALCNNVQSDLRIELRLVWCGGMRILERIEQNGYDVFRKRPTLRYRDKGLMLWRTVSWPKRTKSPRAA